jgi:hypothetical protein
MYDGLLDRVIGATFIAYLTMYPTHAPLRISFKNTVMIIPFFWIVDCETSIFYEIL